MLVRNSNMELLCSEYKVGYVFPMVVVYILSHAEFGRRIIGKAHPTLLCARFIINVGIQHFYVHVIFCFDMMTPFGRFGGILAKVWR